jgi:hypothetical protein
MSMDLGKAWIALGRDPEEVVEELRGHGTVDERIAAAERMLREAERTAKVLMGRYHPDANPDDPGAPKMFMKVKEAIETIRMHTRIVSQRGTRNNQPVIIKI